MITMLAYGDELGHPFWIAKVLEFIKDEIRNKLKLIVIIQLVKMLL